MGDWWKEVRRMLGTRHSASDKGLEDEIAESARRREAEAADREDARRRVAALDLRVEVLTGRMDKHERKKSH